MASVAILEGMIKEKCAEMIQSTHVYRSQITVTVARNHLISFMQFVRDNENFAFEQLMDLCGIDYLNYGISDWATHDATATGFSRGVEKHQEVLVKTPEYRYAVVYQLLSIKHNHRMRVKVFLDDPVALSLSSVVAIWPAANWFEREAFDLFGFIFEGHPDLRRILTDYGFVGHPFRKDFPLIGEVEPRYDAATQKIVYEPVSIAMRTLVPKVIRDDQRYS